MKEILGGSLMRFMINMSDRKEYERHQRTYNGKQYEVWEVSDELFDDMCDMSEEEFVELAGEDAWWRQSDGSNQGSPDTEFKINGFDIFAWDGRRRKEMMRCKFCEDKEFLGCEMSEEDILDCYGEKEYSSLSEYLCDEMGCSQPKNVCALSVDLARYNKMTLGELFSKLEV